MRIGVINGLRGLAFLAVLWHHLGSSLTPPGLGGYTAFAYPLPIFAFLSNGWLGVNLFFLLSGVVLYLPFASGGRSLGDRDAVLAFYRRRAARLLPLYYFSLVVAMVFVARPTLDAHGAIELLQMLSLTFSFSAATFAPRFNWVLWSLGIELWLSLLFPLLVFAARRFGIMKMLGGILVLSLLVRLISIAPWVGDGFDLPGNPYLGVLKDSVLGRLDDFAIGMFLADRLSKIHNLSNLSGPSNPAQVGLDWRSPTGVLVLWMGCACWDLRALAILPAALVPFINLLVDGGFYLLILAAVSSRGLLGKILTSDTLQVPGRMCYSLYVWHGLILVAVVRGQLDAPHLTLYFALLGTLAALSYRYLEFGSVVDARSLFQGVRDRSPPRA